MIRFPAEWEHQSAVLIAWPHASGDFSTRLNAVEASYQFIALTIAQHQRLVIVCHDVIHQQHIQALLGEQPQISFCQAQLNDIWVRDTVFLTVEIDGQVQLCNFRFNGWGEKYPHEFDNALNTTLLTTTLFAGIAHQESEFILEGGSIESDGAGTLLTTRQCLLNENRNKGLSVIDIEQHLQNSLGAQRILWLDQENLTGDDTDAHIDTLARFCSSSTIAYTACTDETDPHYQGLHAMHEQLAALRTVDNLPYHLVPLPMPKAIYDEQGQQLPANYANFLIINGAVMVPVYDDPHDDIALARLAECFPERKIIATPCRSLVHQYGSLHCMTMQFPAGVFAV
ncbi:MAG: agmatine deiminase family protein [Methylovulum sp.]|jgi:agmatine/peptidylarginine deiminase|nr:agmatine deiminase family protein [Methylovulum sp.]